MSVVIASVPFMLLWIKMHHAFELGDCLQLSSSFCLVPTYGLTLLNVIIVIKDKMNLQITVNLLELSRKMNANKTVKKALSRQAC